MIHRDFSQYSKIALVFFKRYSECDSCVLYCTILLYNINYLCSIVATAQVYFNEPFWVGEVLCFVRNQFSPIRRVVDVNSNRHID